jgi:hypothetical protein
VLLGGGMGLRWQSRRYHVREADSLVTAVRAHRFLWTVDKETGVATAKNYEPLKRPRRQDWDGELVENGAFYMTTKACLEKYARVPFEHVHMHTVPWYTSHPCCLEALCAPLLARVRSKRSVSSVARMCV